jgi:PAS domain S-box-containing protein
MSTAAEFERLKSSYTELELRLARFSSVQQELISARDQLDQELEMYKRMLAFNQSALIDQTGLSFIRLVADALIDIFEVEYSIVHFESNPTFKGTLTFFQDKFLAGYEQQVWVDAIRALDPLLSESKSISITPTSETSLTPFVNYQSILAIRVEEPSVPFRFYMLGLISVSKAPFYPPIRPSYNTILGLLAQQTKSWFLLRHKRKLIDVQMQQLENADRELRKLSLIATKAKSGVVITNAFGEIEWVNESFERTTGYALAEVKGKKPKDFLQGPETDLEARRKLTEALRDKQSVEVTLINYSKEGKPYYNQLQVTPIFDDSGQHINFIALQKDITVEKRFETEILRINSRLERITTRSSIGIWEWEQESGRVFWNDVMSTVFQMEPVSHIDLAKPLWEALIHPDDRSRIVQDIMDLAKGDRLVAEHEYRICRSAGEEPRIVRSFVIMEDDPMTGTRRMIGITTDITEKRQYDIRIIRKNDELRKINAELDNFVYSISHDLRSPLLSIKGILHLIKDERDLTEKSRRFLDMAVVSTDRLDHTIQEILDYSRNSRLELQVSHFNVVELVQEIFADLHFTNSAMLQLSVHIKGDPLIETDRYRLGTLLKNIIGNAVKYQQADIDHPFVRVQISHVDDELKVLVEDNGQGIAQEHQKRVFEMFYRGASKVQGTGLGLYICQEIANKLSGKLSLFSKENVGTTVTFEMTLNSSV